LDDLEVRDHSEDLGIDERIISDWILWKYGGKAWARYMILDTDLWWTPVNMVMNVHIT
jgi:hypothetical protein